MTLRREVVSFTEAQDSAGQLEQESLRFSTGIPRPSHNPGPGANAVGFTSAGTSRCIADHRRPVFRRGVVGGPRVKKQRLQPIFLAIAMATGSASRAGIDHPSVSPARMRRYFYRPQPWPLSGADSGKIRRSNNQRMIVYQGVDVLRRFPQGRFGDQERHNGKGG